MAKNKNIPIAGLRVLYIEDEAAQRQELSEQLTGRGHTIFSKASGSEGLDFLEKEKVDIVLCDLNMPKMNGLEFLQAIRKEKIGLPFILVTAHGSIELAKKAIHQGVYHFLMKPFDIANIEILMYQAVEHSSLQRELQDKASQLESSTYELANANVALLTTREKLEEKQKEMENLLEELTKSKEELQAILDASPSAIVMANRYGKVGSVNSKVESFFGIKKEEVLGSQFQQFGQRITKCFDDEKRYADTLQSMWKRPDAKRPELTFAEHSFASALKIKNPSERYVIINTLSVLNDEKEELGRVWVYDDVTVLKRADEQLHTLIESSPVPLLISRLADGRIVYVNETLAKLVGYSVNEMLGMKTLAFYADPSDREKIIEKLKVQKHVPGQELRIRRRDGADFWTIASLGITELNGEVVIVGGFYDISDRKEAERALRVSEERFRGFVENANDVVFSMNPAAILTYLSPRFTHLLGWQPADFIGKPISALMHPEDLKLAHRWITSEFEDTRWETKDGFRLMHKNGEWRWFTSDAAVIRNEDSKLVEVIGIAHDITEIRQLVMDLERANKELKDAQTQLVQSEKMASLGMLVAGIAHEINTPVGAISSMHDSLTRGFNKLREEVNKAGFKEEDKKRFESLFKIVDEANRVIYSGAERVASIVKRLRSFARLDEAELKTVNIHEGIEDTLTLINHELKHNVEVVRKFGKVGPIPCFPGQLNQVFLNLIVNARQAIRGKGTITISTKKENEKVIIKISDTGAGIATEHLSKIFDPGFTTKGVGVGTGLGLSICYQIIKSHHGDITVQSEAGRGTTFTITLPTNLDKLIGKS